MWFYWARYYDIIEDERQFGLVISVLLGFLITAFGQIWSNIDYKLMELEESGQLIA